MRIMDNIASKFRGSMMGSLLGDCLGAPYEGDANVSKTVLQNYFDKLEGPYFEAPVKKYTDDTAMTKSVAKSLISEGKFEPKDVARRFVKEFFKDHRRGYGSQVKDVFLKLRAEKIKDPFGPAKKQFDGSGSYGNGGAMRVSPVALFYHSNYNMLVDTAKKSAEITHTHKNGYNGAVLQAIAVQQSLHLDPKQPVDVKSYASELTKKMQEIEKEEGDGIVEDEDPTPYTTQLQIMEYLLEKDCVSDAEVVQQLGNSIAALYSVPTAIFCFLRAQSCIPDIETDNRFRRALQYAISLGGDTDTIASMTGAIAGAYHGYETINTSVQRHCEISDKVLRYAEDLYAKHKPVCVSDSASCQSAQFHCV